MLSNMKHENQQIRVIKTQKHVDFPSDSKGTQGNTLIYTMFLLYYYINPIIFAVCKYIFK